jgi:hypothetical protein
MSNAEDVKDKPTDAEDEVCVEYADIGELSESIHLLARAARILEGGQRDDSRCAALEEIDDAIGRACRLVAPGA